MGLLDNSAGTAMRPGTFWTRERVDAWLADFYRREGAIRGERTARQAVDAFFAEHFAVIHCTVCGERIERGNRDRVAWASVRKCDACAAAKRQAGATKFCRQCRTPLSRPKAEGSRTEASITKGWATMSTCATCKETNAAVEKQAEAHARAAREEGKQAYRASLSPGLQRRIRRGGG